MAKTIIDDPDVTIGGTDYSAQVSSAELNLSREVQDSTNFDSGLDTESVVGMRSASITLNFKKDANLSGLDAAIFTQYNTDAATGLAFVLSRDASVAIGTTNPDYSGTLQVTEWSPIQGSVGDLYGGSVTWPVTGAVTRATS